MEELCRTQDDAAHLTSTADTRVPGWTLVVWQPSTALSNCGSWRRLRPHAVHMLHAVPRHCQAHQAQQLQQQGVRGGVVLQRTLQDGNLLLCQCCLC